MPGPDTGDTELLIESLRAAGEIARTFFHSTFKTWDKRGTPVTDADIAIDTMLRTRLMAARPSYGWLSEETADTPDRLTRARVFVVDPIDGTVAFVKRRPHFSISAAVVENGRPIFAAIYNPMTEEMFAATSNAGATLNGAPIQASTTPTFDTARVLGPKTDFGVGWPESLQIENRSSVAYRMALVAKGEFDAMASLSQKGDWDLAASDLIAREAGARVTTRTGENLSFNGTVPLQGSVICAGPALHTLLLAKLDNS